MPTTFHPKPDEHGKPVTIHKPHEPSTPHTWRNPSVVATVTPGGKLPAEINGIPVTTWADAPTTDDEWAHVDGQHGGLFDEPIFEPTPGKRTAAGVVIEESDGRVWVVHPSNAFGGYQATFPKGTEESGATLQRTAIREAFEECGLQVQITGFLADSERSQSKTRYYLARRVGGNPMDMGWESQAVSLAPLTKLGEVLTHHNDAPLVKALQKEHRPARRDIIKYEFGLTSGFRILATVNGFHRKYGTWPCRLLMEKGMAGAIKADVLTPLGWEMMASKMEIESIDEGTVIAEGKDGACCNYSIDAGEEAPATGPRADEWIWGLRLANGGSAMQNRFQLGHAYYDAFQAQGLVQVNMEAIEASIVSGDTGKALHELIERYRDERMLDGKLVALYQRAICGWLLHAGGGDRAGAQIRQTAPL